MAGTVAPGKKASKNERVNIAYRVIARKEEQQGGGQIGNKVFVLLLDGRNIEGREEEEMDPVQNDIERLPIRVSALVVLSQRVNQRGKERNIVRKVHDRRFETTHLDDRVNHLVHQVILLSIRICEAALLLRKKPRHHLKI